MTPYLFVKFLHVLAAIVAVGTTLTYALLLARAHREPAHLGHVLESVRALDRRVAMPGFAVVLLTGLLLVGLGPATITTSWVLASLVLFVLVAAIGAVALAPTMRAMRQSLAAGDAHATVSYARTRSRANRLIAAAIGLVVVIVYLMVVKP